MHISKGPWKYMNSLLSISGDDEFLGRATVATSIVEETGEIKNMWAELEDVTTGKILMSLSWLPASKNKSDLQGKCILFLYDSRLL